MNERRKITGFYPLSVPGDTRNACREDSLSPDTHDIWLLAKYGHLGAQGGGSYRHAI